MLRKAYVFKGPRSDRLSYVLTSCLFRKYRKLAKFPKGLTFHSLRETGASPGLRFGCTVPASGDVPIRSIQKLLGHCDLRMALKIYADVLNTAQPNLG